MPPGAVFLGKPYSHATLVSHVLAATEKAQAARALAKPQGGTDGTADGAAAPIPKTA
ncbi:hypothetical protein [Microvirga tunisiensis]|uniref:hypothetical protein n=1 Tax=Microvirga tunisiensis TaxID=2108360 RepID=UPI001FCE35F7|nr:hypothetical protein [Microvirga tunisiensis]